MIELRSAAEIEAMRPAGRALRRRGAQRSSVRASDRASITGELDRTAGLIRERGATSCYIDYHPSFVIRRHRDEH